MIFGVSIKNLRSLQNAQNYALVDFMSSIIYIVYTADASSRDPATISTPGDNLIQVIMTTVMEPQGGLMTQDGRSSSTRPAAATGLDSEERTSTYTSTAAHLQPIDVADKYDANGKVLCDFSCSGV